MIFVKKYQIFFYFVSGKISLEIVSHDVLKKKKKLFTTIKMTTFQKAKNANFAKGLTHDFSQKIQNFFFFFGGKMSQEIMFHDVLDKKETILQKKNKIFSF